MRNRVNRNDKAQPPSYFSNSNQQSFQTVTQTHMPLANATIYRAKTKNANSGNTIKHLNENSFETNSLQNLISL